MTSKNRLEFLRSFLIAAMEQFNSLLFVLLLFVCSVCAHKCTHDEYVKSKNIPKTVSHQSYLNHPFEAHADKSRRLNSNWQPIRIHVDTSDIASHGSAAPNAERELPSVDAVEAMLQTRWTSLLHGLKRNPRPWKNTGVKPAILYDSTLQGEARCNQYHRCC